MEENNNQKKYEIIKVTPAEPKPFNQTAFDALKAEAVKSEQEEQVLTVFPEYSYGSTRINLDGKLSEEQKVKKAELDDALNFRLGRTGYASYVKMDDTGKYVIDPTTIAQKSEFFKKLSPSEIGNFDANEESINNYLLRKDYSTIGNISAFKTAGEYGIKKGHQFENKMFNILNNNYMKEHKTTEGMDKRKTTEISFEGDNWKGRIDFLQAFDEKGKLFYPVRETETGGFEIDQEAIGKASRVEIGEFKHSLRYNKAKRIDSMKGFHKDNLKSYGINDKFIGGPDEKSSQQLALYMNYIRTLVPKGIPVNANVYWKNSPIHSDKFPLGHNTNYRSGKYTINENDESYKDAMEKSRAFEKFKEKFKGGLVLWKK